MKHLIKKPTRVSNTLTLTVCIIASLLVLIVLFSGKTILADKKPAEKSYDPSTPIPAVKHEAYTFKDEGLETIMYKLRKWYDNGFIYNRPIRERFTGTIPENASLDEALRILETKSTIRFGRYGYIVVISKY